MILLLIVCHCKKTLCFPIILFQINFEWRKPHITLKQTFLKARLSNEC